MKVILTEKPSVAQEIAKVLGINKRQEGYFENNQYQITWAFGHLVELEDPAAYKEQYAKWDLKDLPIFPSKFLLKLKNEASVKKQYKTIRNLFSTASSIINATDAGREGELIFRYIYNLSGVNKPVERLWISSMTEESIQKGFKNLQKGEKYDNLYDSAYARSIADWVIGLNLTRALTLKEKSQKPLSVGRVQTPTLAMVCQRYLENKNFTSKPFFTPVLNLNHSQKDFKAYYQYQEYLSEQQAQKIIGESQSKPVILKEIKDEIKTVKPELLLDLTTLQQICNKRFGFTANKTLDLTQSLYEKHKAVTYPRTDSRYLTDDMYQTVVDTLSVIEKLNIESNVFSEIKVSVSNTRIFNNDKVNDHHAIIPTLNNNLPSVYKTLTEDEKKVFESITEYFIKAFLPDYKYRSLIYHFFIDNYLFKSTGKSEIQKGFKISVFNKTEDTDEEQDHDIIQNLPEIPLHTNFKNYTFQIEQGKTQPPALLTEASLLKYMNNVQTFFKEDADELENIKKSGIGTPATRAGIIEILKFRNFITTQKKNIIPTEIGLHMYHIFKDMEIGKPIITAHLEEKLELIQTGTKSLDNILPYIKEFTENSLKEILTLSLGEIGNTVNQKETIEVKCPKCGHPHLIVTPKNYYCPEYPKCDFSIYNKFFEKKLSPKLVTEILTKGKSKSKIEGLKAKSGKIFSAYIVFNSKSNKLELEFN